ncbi:MAG TPA: hypothetical protein VN922_06865 [Bacteroidia bacterium]|nr:hypothetical protein [Bacteroidia bacterium]
MKTLVIIIFSGLFWNNSFSQISNFEFTYGRYTSCGILHWVAYPLIKIKNDTLFYTYKQRTSKYKIENYKDINYIDTIWVYDTCTKKVVFRPQSKDSVIKAIKQINDTLNVSMYLSPGDFDVRKMMLKSKRGKQLTIEYVNTFDSTAVSIVNILNDYLPCGYKIAIPYNEWRQDIWYRNHIDSILKSYISTTPKN